MKVDLQSVFVLVVLTPMLSTGDSVVPNVQRLSQLVVSEQSSSSNWRKATIHFKLGTKRDGTNNGRPQNHTDDGS